MKLSSEHIDRALTQFDAQPIPENHPVVQKFNNLFGEHTYFLDQDGLNIVEPAESGDNNVEAGQVVKLASWVDDKRTALAPHEWEQRDIVVVLGLAA